MITIELMSVMRIVVDCEHGTTKAEVVAPIGMPTREKSQMLDSAIQMTIDHHRADEPSCECEIEGADETVARTGIARDRLN